jgi:hypothetical protein
MLLTFMVCASILAAEPRRAAESEAMSDLRIRHKAPKGKRTFHPLRLLRRLGNAESEFALRLSSWGIPREGDTVNSEALPRPSPVTEVSKSMTQGFSAASQ